jgi:hypothetical protein
VETAASVAATEMQARSDAKNPTALKELVCGLGAGTETRLIPGFSNKKTAFGRFFVAEILFAGLVQCF